MKRNEGDKNEAQMYHPTASPRILKKCVSHLQAEQLKGSGWKHRRKGEAVSPGSLWRMFWSKKLDALLSSWIHELSI
eukprot:scaffold52_cov183-Cylindrotheca_fusiformis.AAC.7